MSERRTDTDFLTALARTLDEQGWHTDYSEHLVAIAARLRSLEVEGERIEGYVVVGWLPHINHRVPVLESKRVIPDRDTAEVEAGSLRKRNEGAEVSFAVAPLILHTPQDTEEGKSDESERR